MVSLKQPTYEEQPARARVILLGVLPAALGIVSGLALGFSGGAYWICQVVAILGGLSAGTECRGAVTAAVRGLISGAVFGAVIIIVRTILDRPDHANLGGTPGLLPVVTAVVSAVLGLIGWVALGRKRAPEAHMRHV